MVRIAYHEALQSLLFSLRKTATLVRMHFWLLLCQPLHFFEQAFDQVRLQTFRDSPRRYMDRSTRVYQRAARDQDYPVYAGCDNDGRSSAS